MKQFIFGLSLILIMQAGQAYAAAEPDYDPSKPPLTTPWYGAVGAAERQADLDFIKGMHPHHAGALTMSQDYLKSKDASDARLQKLAKGIILNQTFEIGMLQAVENLMLPPAPETGSEWRQTAVRGLAQKQRFVRAPLPVLWGGGPVSKRDVQFAKAMIVHHEGALTMCKDYLGKPAANNKYLRLLCVDILKDQALDIDFMHAVINDYPGNPDDVKIDASMIHGMEGMSHGGGHGTHDTGKKPAVHKAHIPPKAEVPEKSHGEHHH